MAELSHFEKELEYLISGSILRFRCDKGSVVDLLVEMFSEIDMIQTVQANLALSLKEHENRCYNIMTSINEITAESAELTSNNSRSCADIQDMLKVIGTREECVDKMLHEENTLKNGVQIIHYRSIATFVSFM